MATSSKVLGITMARGGSKGVPRKNIKILHGQPLLAYAIKNALRSTQITDYCVSSEDYEIQQVAKDYGAEVVDRPQALALDSTTAQETLQHAVEVMEERKNTTYDYVIDIRATNPFIRLRDINGALDKLKGTGAKSVIGVQKTEYPARVKRIVDDRIEDWISESPMGNRQYLAEGWTRNGSIYALTRDELMFGKLFGQFDSRPWYTETGVNIDTQEDWDAAECLAEQWVKERKWDE